MKGGKVVAVIGGGAGIGEATTSRLSASGWSVAVLDIIEPRVESGAGIALHCDARDERSVAAGLAETVRLLGPLSGLATIAGGNSSKAARPVNLLDRSAWDSIIELNLTSVFLAVKHAVPLMRDAGGGAIVLLSSGSARTGRPHPSAAYISAKAAVAAFARTTAWELAPLNIRINTVSPGLVLTEGVRSRIPEEALRKQEIERLNEQADKRLTNADEVAQAIAFLLSDAASAITGRDLPVDHGWLP